MRPIDFPYYVFFSEMLNHDCLALYRAYKKERYSNSLPSKRIFQYPVEMMVISKIKPTIQSFNDKTYINK